MLFSSSFYFSFKKTRMPGCVDAVCQNALIAPVEVCTEGEQITLGFSPVVIP
jgi:hypothetical protein